MVLVGGGVLLLASCETTPQTTFVVTTTADGRDAAPGDGTCEMTPGAGDCSLRAAIDEVNVGTPDPPQIELPAGRYEITPGADDDANATGDLDLAPAAGTLQINGPDAVIDGLAGAGPLDVRSGHVTLARVAVTNGTDAVHVTAGAELTVVLATVHGNAGAGVRVDAGATASVVQATVSTNSGPGIDNDGTIALTYATITANGTGGVGGSGSGTALASIVADQAGGPDCSVPLTSDGHNLDGDGSCGLAEPSDASGGANLGPLSTDAVPFHVPDPVSAAVDSIAVAADRCGSGPGIIDQRKVGRPINGSCDRGAIEAPAPAVELLVDDAADAPDATPGNGRCDDALGGCTLRAAIDEVQAGTDLPIVIAPGIDPVLSITGTDDTNAAGDLDIATATSITGNGTTVDANLIDRAFHVRSGATLTLTGVSVTRGRADTGGAIRVDADADATITDATFTGNEAAGVESCSFNEFFVSCGGEGGGGAVWVGGSATIDRSTFSENRSTGDGGCVASPSPGPGSSYTTCSWADGGAIRGSATTTVRSSTFSANRVRSGQGGAVRGGAAKREHLRRQLVRDPVRHPPRVTGRPRRHRSGDHPRRVGPDRAGAAVRHDGVRWPQRRVRRLVRSATERLGRHRSTARPSRRQRRAHRHLPPVRQLTGGRRHPRRHRGALRRIHRHRPARGRSPRRRWLRRRLGRRDERVPRRRHRRRRGRCRRCARRRPR